MRAILALDIGEKRVGVAVAEEPVFLAHALPTLANDEGLVDKITDLLKSRGCSKLVVGYPRNQSGAPTAQTKMVENTIADLKVSEAVEVVWQDESLTSVKAKAELEERGKPYDKGDVDALAATYILEDYLRANI